MYIYVYCIFVCVCVCIHTVYIFFVFFPFGVGGLCSVCRPGFCFRWISETDELSNAVCQRVASSVSSRLQTSFLEAHSSWGSMARALLHFLAAVVRLCSSPSVCVRACVRLCMFQCVFLGDYGEYLRVLTGFYFTDQRWVTCQVCLQNSARLIFCGGEVGVGGFWALCGE